MSPKKRYQWQISTQKDAKHHLKLEKYQFKTQNPTTHLLEKLRLNKQKKRKTLTIASVISDVE